MSYINQGDTAVSDFLSQKLFDFEDEEQGLISPAKVKSPNNYAAVADTPRSKAAYDDKLRTATEKLKSATMSAASPRVSSFSRSSVAFKSEIPYGDVKGFLAEVGSRDLKVHAYSFWERCMETSTPILNILLTIAMVFSFYQATVWELEEMNKA